MDFASIDTFKDLNQAQKSRLSEIAVQQHIAGGEVLMEEGRPSDSMYFVLSGRFSVSIAAQQSRLAEIGPGQTVGEIGFLSGDVRSATATAIRDSLVLKLKRKDYDLLCREMPEIIHSVSVSLARKLAATTQSFKEKQYIPARTLAVCSAGRKPLQSAFVSKLARALEHFGRSTVIDETVIQSRFPNQDLSSTVVIHWLNQQENEFDFVLYAIGPEQSEWSALATRQADKALLIVDKTGENSSTNAPALNEVEAQIFSVSDQSHCQLVFLHDDASVINDSQLWLEPRDVCLHHHVQMNNASHIARLSRFIVGQAVGLVASGGGAYCAAHVGFFQALDEAGIRADIFGGSSGGAATVAAMTVDHVSFEEMSDIIEFIFITSGAFKRFTLPIYSLLDHRAFDAALNKVYDNRQIEDLTRNFFAVSTNLSMGAEVVHRQGLLWQAIRASASIPALLPPFTTEAGDVLVDGGIIDNVPLSTMQRIKSGPNLSLAFEPKRSITSTTRYEKMPGRGQLIRQMMNPLTSATRPGVPKIGSILMQCLLLNNSSLDQAQASDLTAYTPLPKDIRLNDWHRHREITRLGYEYGLRWLEQERDNAELQKIITLLAD